MNCGTSPAMIALERHRIESTPNFKEGHSNQEAAFLYVSFHCNTCYVSFKLKACNFCTFATCSEMRYDLTMGNIVIIC